MKLLNSIAETVTTDKKAQYFYFIAIFMLLFMAMLFFYPLREGHDLQSHYGRMMALSQAILDGSFPVYFDQSMILGYGFATRYFYGDLVLLPFSILVPYIGVVNSYQIMVVFYSLLCAIITFVSVNKTFNNRYIAFIATILFTFSYYRLYDVYNRAAVGETICLTFLPLIMWGAYEIVKGNYKKWYIITIGFSMMIFAHVNTPAIVAFTLAIFLVFNYKALIQEPKRIAYLFLAAGVTVLITAYFLFPLFEHLLSNEFYFNTSDTAKRLTSNVMFGEPMKYVIRGLFSGATYVVPEIAGIGVVLTMVVCTRIFISRDSVVKRGDLYLIVGLICMFIISPFYPWRVFPFNIIGFIQFSWRFYAVATFVFCIAGAIYFYKAFSSKNRLFFAGIPFLSIITLIVIANSGQVYSNNFKESRVIAPSIENSYWVYGGDYVPSVAPNTDEFFHQRGRDSIRIGSGESTITAYKKELRLLQFNLNKATSIQEEELELPLIYYVGYKAEQDGKAIDISQSENGLIQIAPKESGTIKVYFGGTLIQNLSPYISLVSIILLISYMVWYNRRKEK